MVSLCCLLGVVGTATATTDADLRKTLLDEGPSVWQSLEDFFGSLEGTLDTHHETTFPGKPPRINDESERFYFTPKGKLYRRMRQAQTGEVEIINGINAVYEFDIERMPMQRNWALNNVTSEVEQQDIESRALAWRRYGKLYIPISVFQAPLIDVLTPEAITSVSRKDKSIEVAFDIPGGMTIYEGERPSDNDMLLSGVVTLDPQSWCVLHYEARVQFARDGIGLLRGEVEYQDRLDGVLLPKRYIEEYDTTDVNGTTGKSTYEFSELKKCTVEPDRFRLTAYGLSEPNYGPDPQYARTIFITAGIVILMIVLGIWMRRRSYA